MILIAAAMLCSTAAIAQSGGSSTGGSTTSQGGSAAQTQAAAGMKLKAVDKAFAEQAARTNLAEIALGELAGEEENLPADVQNLARQSLQDHQMAQQELEQLAETHGIELPDDPAPRQTQAAEMLGDLDGAQFAAEFARIQVEEHQVAVDAFERYAKKATGGSRNPLQAYAQKHLPRLQAHLELAQQAQGSLNPTATRE
jgi:putative membrane protein